MKNNKTIRHTVRKHKKSAHSSIQLAGGGGDKNRANASLPPKADRNPASEARVGWGSRRKMAISRSVPADAGEGTRAPTTVPEVGGGCCKTPNALSRRSGTTSPACAAPRHSSSAISMTSDTACRQRNRRLGENKSCTRIHYHASNHRSL